MTYTATAALMPAFDYASRAYAADPRSRHVGTRRVKRDVEVFSAETLEDDDYSDDYDDMLVQEAERRLSGDCKVVEFEDVLKRLGMTYDDLDPNIIATE